MPKRHPMIGSQRALIKRMGTQGNGIKGVIITASDGKNTASMYVRGLTLGTLTQAQKEAFTAEFAKILGINANLLTLTFTEGSLIIGITIDPSQISTPNDNKFVTNAQAALSQISNNDITTMIVNSQSTGQIVGSPSIDPSKTTTNIDPLVKANSAAKYIKYEITNPIVSDGVKNCFYTLLDSNIVRITNTGSIESICAFTESSITNIFIARENTCLVIPGNIVIDTDPSYPGRQSVYVINISSGMIYTNNVTILFRNSAGFNSFNNCFYYISAEQVSYGKLYNAEINFSNGPITSQEIGTFNNILGNIVFSNINTGYFNNVTNIGKIDLSTNTTSTIAGVYYGEPITSGKWNNTNSVFGSPTGNVYGPFKDGNGPNAHFSSISDLTFDAINNRLLVADIYAQRIRSIDLNSPNYPVTTLAGTSPVLYGEAKNSTTSQYSPQELASMGQVGAWGTAASGMPAFTKVNSTYALSTFNNPRSITLFNNTILVVDEIGTRVLSNGYVNDLIVLGTSTDLITFSDLGGGPTVTFKITNATYTSLTIAEIDALKNEFLNLYPNIDPNAVAFTLTSGNINVRIAYNGSTNINFISPERVSTVCNLDSVFSDRPSILKNFKQAVITTNLSDKITFDVNVVINDTDVSVNLDLRIRDKCKEKVSQLSPILMCFGPDKIYTTDLKNSILILNPNNGSSTVLVTIPPIIGSYLYRKLFFNGITINGRYLTVSDGYYVNDSQQGNYECDYVYRIDTSNGNCEKVKLFDTSIDFFNKTFYNNFTDTLYYSPNVGTIQPISYRFTDLKTYTTGVSTEKIPTVMIGGLWVDKDNMLYISKGVLKKWNFLTGIETNIIGVEQTLTTRPAITSTTTSVPSSSVWGKYNYTTPVKFASQVDNFPWSKTGYDSITDTLSFMDGPSKCLVIIKNVLNGVASIDQVIGKPNTDLDSDGYVNNKLYLYSGSSSSFSYSIEPRNTSGTDSGLTSNVEWTTPYWMYVQPGSGLKFVLKFNRDVYRTLTNTNDYWKCFSMSKIQGNIITPITMFNTSPTGLIIKGIYSTSSVSIYVAGPTLGSLTQTQIDAFKLELATKLGVTPDLITLTFRSGSLILDISINTYKVATLGDNAFIINAPAVISQLTDSDITDIITKSNTGVSITGTATINHDRTVIDIDINLQDNCIKKYTKQTIYNPIVGDDVNKCMYTVLNSKIVRIDKNGQFNTICSFPEDRIRHIFITLDSNYLVIPSNDFSSDNVNPPGQSNLQYNASHSNKFYIINISTQITYINTILPHFYSSLSFNKFNNTLYYSIADTIGYGDMHTSTVVFSNSQIASIKSNISNLIEPKFIFTDETTGFVNNYYGIQKINLSNGDYSFIAGRARDSENFGIWNNVPVTSPGSNGWGNASGGAYNPFADSLIGTNAFFVGISSILADLVNNRILVVDSYSQRIRSVDLTPGNDYAVTTLAGTSPIKYGVAINSSESNFTQELLSSLGQIGVWNKSISGMPAFTKVNSTYALSTFDNPRSITLFNNTLLVLDATGTRVLSNGYVNDFKVIGQ